MFNFNNSKSTDSRRIINNAIHSKTSRRSPSKKSVTNSSSNSSSSKRSDIANQDFRSVINVAKIDSMNIINCNSHLLINRRPKRSSIF